MFWQHFGIVIAIFNNLFYYYDFVYTLVGNVSDFKYSGLV